MISIALPPQSAHLPIKPFLEHLYHPEMPEKVERAHGKISWDDKQRFHVLGLLIEHLGSNAVERFIQQRRAAPNPAAGGPTASSA